MRAFPGDPGFLVDWQHVPETNPVLPFATAFGSSRFEPDRLDLEGIGERRQVFYPLAQTRLNGLLRGQHVCGTEDQWLNGYPDGTPGIEVIDGVPVCCLPDLLSAYDEGYDLGYDSPLD